MTQAAVLTGDLIGSTEAGPEAVDRAMDWLSVILYDTQKAFDIEPTRFTRYRGDGWQAVIIPSSQYLRTLTYILTGSKAMDLLLDTRVGIGMGSVEKLGKLVLSDASGQAFINSGHALDEISGNERLAIKGLPNPDINWHKGALETLSYFSGRWSVEQAAALQVRLVQDHRSLHDIASGMGITRQALSSRLAVAGEKPIMAAIRAAEATL